MIDLMRAHGGLVAFSPEEHFERRGIAYRQRDRDFAGLLRDVGVRCGSAI